MKTKTENQIFNHYKQINNLFWDFLNETAPHLAAHRNKEKTQNDYCTDIRVAYCDWVAMMHRDGQINSSVANNITL